MEKPKRTFWPTQYPGSLGQRGAEPVNKGAHVARSLAEQHAMLWPTVSDRLEVEPKLRILPGPGWQ